MGKRTLPQRIDDLAVARARPGDDGGFYFRTPGGAAGEQRPGEQRVRMIGRDAPAAAQAFFDLPGTPAFSRRGSALIGGEVYALTDSARIWLWGPSGGHVYSVPGLHDLTLAVVGSGLFATAAKGRARYFSA